MKTRKNSYYSNKMILKVLRIFIGFILGVTPSISAPGATHASYATAADFDDLLRSVQLSVLYTADDLLKDLTDLIACHWLIPEKSVKVWLLAKKLKLTTLRDLAKATCIDRFSDLPDPSLLELSGDDFIDLAGSLHTKASQKFLLALVERWVDRNIPPGETNEFASRYPFTLKSSIGFEDFQSRYERQQSKCNIQCIVGHKKTEDNEEKSCVYCWDGITFSEIVEIPKFSTTAIGSLVGMRALGRGFDIYLIGGEYGQDTGHYQKEIWRYSMISKTWYYVTSMPKSRCHMAAAFLNDKLVLIGGQKRNRSTRSTVDIYNVYTGIWRKAPYAQHSLTNTTPMYIEHGRLEFHLDSDTFLYDSNEDEWMHFSSSYWGIVPNQSETVQFAEKLVVRNLMGYDKNLYVLDDESPTKIWVMGDIQKLELNLVGSCSTLFDNLVTNAPYAIGFSCKNGTVFVEMVKITGYNTMKSEIVYKVERGDVRDLCPENTIGCFNIPKLNSLNELFVLCDEERL